LDFDFTNYAKEAKILKYAHESKRYQRGSLCKLALNTTYILAEKELAKEAQKIADDYMFDAKVLLFDASEDDIEFCALNSIDGIVLSF